MAPVPTSPAPLPASPRARRARALLLGGLLLAGVATGCSRADAGKATLPPPPTGSERVVGVRAERPLTHLEGGVARTTGQLRSKLEATLSAPVSGTIQEVLVSPGDRVKKGTPLVRLDASNVRIQLQQAQAARRIAAAARQSAQSDLGRTQTLHEGGSAPAAVLERAQAGFEQADASLAQADAQVRAVEESLRDHTMRAPFDGVVTARMKNVGDYVAMMPPTPVLSLTDTDSLEIRAAVPEALALRLSPGQALRGRSVPQGLGFEATVRSVGAVVDPQSRSIEILADVKPAEGGGVLRPGSLAELELAQAAPGLYLPSTAVLSEGERRFLWVLAGDAVSRREVSVEPATPRFVRVTEGLTAEERVVTEGAAGLQEGQKVRVASAHTAAPR